VLEQRAMLSTFTVNSTADSAPANNPTPGTLRWAVEQASAASGGALINFDLTTPATITLAQGELVLRSVAKGSIVIEGPGAGLLSISGGGQSRVFYAYPNQTPDGGLTAIISGVTITGGSTTGNGGGLDNQGIVDLLDCTLSGNSASGNGGALYNNGQTTLIDCTIDDNSAGAAGSFGRGGGLANERIGYMTLTGCTISGNTAGSVGFGGGLYNDGTANLADCTISNNLAVNSGSGSDGGGVDSASSVPLNLTDCTITGNTASDGGGVMASFRVSVDLTDCTVDGNSAASYGGGVCAFGTANLDGCTIDGNSAAGAGGGVEVGYSQATLTNCTISGNSSPEGGGLDNYATAQLTSCTISGNTGSVGGGLSNDSYPNAPPMATLTDTIVAGNTLPGGAASDIGGAGSNNVTGTYNLIGTGGSGAISGGTDGNQVGVADPGLGALANNGGLTQTIALQTGSPAIGAGIGTGAPTTDQRGMPRPSTGSIDIGAFETQAGNVEPPIASYQAATTELGASLNGQVSADDPNGDSLTYSLVTSPAHGSVTFQADGSFTYTPSSSFGFTGVDSFTFQAFDGIAYSNVATVSIVIYPVSLAPVANNDSYSTPENTTLTVAAPGVLANDTDPNGLPLTALLVTGPSDGTLTLNSDGSFTYIPDTNFGGTDSFTYQASDGQFDSNVATVTITVGNPPVANNDSYTANENTTLTVAAPGVLANDTNPTGQPMTAVLVTGPLDGTLTLNSDGSFTYAPDTNFTGSDSFTYQAVAGGLASNVATVTLKVIDQPVAQNDTYGYIPNTPLTTSAAQTSVTMTSQPGDFIGQGQTYDFTPANSAITAHFLTNGVITTGVEVDVSASGQSWTLDFAAPSPGYLVPGTYTGVARWPFQPAGVPGLDVSGDGRGANTLTGQFTVDQIAYNTSGGLVAFGASFVQYADGSTAALSGQVDFHFTNNEPNGVLANDSDPNPNATLTAVLVSPPSHGTLTFNSDGSFTYTPSAGFNGTDSFTYEASNGLAYSNVATITLTPDQPPVAQGDAYTVAENGLLTAGEGPTFLTMNSQPGDFIGQGQAYDYTPANSTITATVLSNSNVVQVTVGQPGLSWTLDFAGPNSGPLEPGVYTGAMNWPGQPSGVPGLSISGEGRGSSSITGAFTVTQAVYDTSGNLVSFAANFVQYSDGSTAPLTGQVAFNCTNTLPAGVLANDSAFNPGASLTAVLVSNPAHGTLVFNPDGSITYAPNPGFVGTDSFTYESNDGFFNSSPAAVAITVAQPLAQNDSYSASLNTALTVPAPGVLAGAIDPNNGPLTAILVAQPADGSVVLNGDGSFTYTPDVNFVGTDTFTYQASDGMATSNTATVTIEVISPNQATFLKSDTKTQGNWIGTYGTQGYVVVGNSTSLPSYATVTPSGQSTRIWTSHTNAVRALEKAGGSGRIAADWYASKSFTIDVDLTDGQTHDLELYFLDWNGTRASELVRISDAVTGLVLSTQTVSSFHSGTYLDYAVSGNIMITITGQLGANALLSGLFLDPAAAGTASISGLTPAPTGGLSTVQASADSPASPQVLGALNDGGPAASSPEGASLSPRAASVNDTSGKLASTVLVRLQARRPRPDGGFLRAAAARFVRQPIGLVRQTRLDGLEQQP
jgi:hypothetical protein